MAYHMVGETKSSNRIRKLETNDTKPGSRVRHESDSWDQTKGPRQIFGFREGNEEKKHTRNKNMADVCLPFFFFLKLGDVVLSTIFSGWDRIVWKAERDESGGGGQAGRGPRLCECE